MKQALLAMFLAFIVSMGTAFAAEDDDNGDPPYHPYLCGPNDDGVETCYCASRYDCNYMIRDGVCDVPMPELGEHATGNDMVCDDNFGGVGEYVCECSAERAAPETSRRPDAFNTPTENAPVSRPRSRRAGDRFEQVPDGTSNTNSPSERRNETVPARRGRSHEADTASEADNETEEASPRRNIRDHRQ